MIRKNKKAGGSGRSRRREEQLELELPQLSAAVVRAMPDLGPTNRLPAASETQTKRLRNGVLVQQMLK